MSDPRKLARAAIEAVAKEFSATFEEGDDPSVAYIMAGGKRVAVEIRALKLRGVGWDNSSRPHLRFDKVAIRLIERLKTTFDETVPKGVTVVFTITAPIRLASKTAAALEHEIRTLLRRKTPGRQKQVIHGNHIRIGLLSDKSGRAAKVIGFVHNSDSESLLLLNMTRELLEQIGEAGKRTTGLASDRWLVVVSPRGISLLEAYRCIYSQLRIATRFEKTLMVFGDGRGGLLTKSTS